MKTLELISYIVSLGGILVLIGFVLLKNPRAKLNQTFALFAFFVFAAITLEAVGEFSRSNTEVLWSVRCALAFGDLLALYFYRYTLAFTAWKPKWDWFPKAALVLAPIFSLTSLLPQTMKSVRVINYGAFVTKAGPLLWVNLLYISIMFATCFVILYRHARKSEKRVQLQVRMMIYGIGLALGLTLVGQVLLPDFHIFQLRATVSAPAILLFVGPIGYAMLRHKMFDIRAAILRSIGYILTIVITTGLYVISILGISRFLFPGLKLSKLQDLYFVLVALVLALSYKTIISFIRKNTNRIFYQEKYNLHELLNKIGQVLASEIQLVGLGNQVTTILNEYLGSKADIIVLEKGKIYFESSGVFKSILDSLNQDLENLSGDLLINEELPDGIQKTVMRKYGIAAAATLKTHNEKIGYLLLGDKNDGSSYDRSEVDLINIVADELAIGFQNSRSFAAVQEFNKSLQAKVNKATSELRIANNKLKDDDLVKDDFITMASHQLSTPLSVIDGYLTLAKQNTYGPLNEKLSQSLGSALERAEVMKSLLIDLLDISRMTAGKFMLQIGPANITKVIEQEVKQLQNLANDKKVKLTFHEPSKQIPTINIDSQKTGQAVMNLVHNALHYAAGGKVDVYLDSDDRAVRVRVIDNGIGVPEAEKAKLFTKFYRADNARKERPNGTGIGLYLVKRVIEDQRGKIIFSSEINKGSTFGFSLPLYHQADVVPSKAGVK